MQFIPSQNATATATDKLLRLLLGPVLVISVLLTSSVQADQPAHEASAAVTLSDAVLLLPIPGSHNSAVFLRMSNTAATPVTLIGVSTDSAAKAQLHLHSQVDGMMRMRPVEAITLAPGETLLFESGGYHIMLLNVQDAINTGDTVELTLEFKGGASHLVQATAVSRYDHANHSQHH